MEGLIYYWTKVKSYIRGKSFLSNYLMFASSFEFGLLSDITLSVFLKVKSFYIF